MNTTTTKTKPAAWKWELGLSLEPKGHRIFRDARNDFQAPELRGWAIADNSGYRPHMTDDGVLWLDFTRPILVRVGKYTGAMLPVTRERCLSDACWVSVGIDAFLTIRKHFPAWPVEMSAEVLTLLSALAVEPAVTP